MSEKDPFELLLEAMVAAQKNYHDLAVEIAKVKTRQDIMWGLLAFAAITVVGLVIKHWIGLK